MSGLELALSEAYPQQKIKVETELDVIIVHFNGEKIRFKLPYPNPIQKIMYPDVDFAKEYTALIISEIENTFKT